MLRNMWFRSVLLGVLVALVGVPANTLTYARQNDGPQSAPPQQQPAPPKTPSGQQQQQPASPAPATPPPQSSISVESNLVNVDVTVTDQDGDVLTGLMKSNFKISDDGQPQQITNFAPSEAPITMVILMEFSRRFGGYFGYKAQYWSFPLLNALTAKDWVALKTFSMRTHVEVDFTQNKNEIGQAIASLFVPDFSEANLFDATLETLEQLRDVKGKKSILILATGFDTFSKHNLDQTLNTVKESDVPIFCVGMGEDLDLYSPQGAGVGYLQAKNQLTTFANLTGGYAWFPRFEGEMPDIFNAVAGFLRSQYTLGFTPTTAQDGKFHKLKVEAVDEQGNPLTVNDKKGKKKKTIVHARQGYLATATSAMN
jgi:VWFA-related protein